jgi:hypothetical protein
MKSHFFFVKVECSEGIKQKQTYSNYYSENRFRAVLDIDHKRKDQLLDTDEHGRHLPLSQCQATILLKLVLFPHSLQYFMDNYESVPDN